MKSTLRSLLRDSINLGFVWSSVQVESICIQLPQAVFVASCFGIPTEGYSYPDRCRRANSYISGSVHSPQYKSTSCMLHIIAAVLPCGNLLSSTIPKVFPSVFQDIYGRPTALSFDLIFLSHWVTFVSFSRSRVARQTFARPSFEM